MTGIFKFLGTLVVMIALVAPVQAQNNAPACQLSGTFTATGRQGGPSNSTLANGYNNKSSGCVNWWLVLTSTGFSATSIAIQSAPDSSGVAGSWSNWAGTVVSGTGLSANPATATTQALINVTGYYPWVSVNAGTLTGTGSVNWTLYGYKGGQVAVAPSSGPGSGTVTSLVASLPIVVTPDPITATGTISCPTCGTGTGNISGSITANQVAYATAMDTLGGDAGFTFDPADSGNGLLQINQTALALGAGQYKTGAFINIGNASNGLDAGLIGLSVSTVGSAGSDAIAELYGIFIGVNVNSGTVANSYGLWVDDVSGATNNYAIKTGAGKVQFGDDLNVGSSGAWKDVHAANFVMESSSLRTDTTDAHTGLIQAYDVDDMTYRSFITLTNGNTPSMVIDAPTGGSLTINTGGGAVQSGGAGKGNGQIKIAGNVSGTITVTTASTTDTWSWTLPTNNGDANQYLMTDGAGISTWTSLPFNASWALPGEPPATTTYPIFVAASGLSFPDNWSGSTCKVLTNATATWTATVKKNGSSVGTVAVATNGTCTFDTTGGATAFASGDYMTITTPSADATLADVMLDFVATRT